MNEQEYQAALWWCSLNRFEMPDDEAFAAWCDVNGFAGFPETEIRERLFHLPSFNRTRYWALMSKLQRCAGGAANTLAVWNDQLPQQGRGN